MFNVELSSRTLNSFSIVTEINKAIEELNELHEELLKMTFKGQFPLFGECKKAYGNLLLEMADVEITLSHLWFIVGGREVFMSAVQEKTEKLKAQLVEQENKTKQKRGKK